ncbi:MAG: peptidoglycan DD-metalloendopeptidase family protein [Ekhidna sp.]
MNAVIKFIFSGLALCSITISSAQETGFGVAHTSENTLECLSHADREEILAILQTRKSSYNSARTEIVKFQWPIRQSNNYDHSETIGISNYVDLDDSSPGDLLDYNCGTRTYDTQSGYNHKGTDIYSWPFTWHKMDHDHIEIVAAASGEIIYKQDFNSDKSCAFNNNRWNAVYVEHSDGSVAWYGHLKANSLTNKEEGDQIEVGEYIGVMGSSGNSTGPHLHLEIYDADNNLIDPYAGSCNSTTSQSWWEEQQDYTIPGINMLATHDAPPELGCYGDEEPNFEVNFTSGSTVYFATYFRDQLDASTSSHRVIRPDGVVYQQWTTTSPQFYSGSYWYRSFSLPTNGNEGKWTFQVDYQGQTASEHFYLTNEDPTISLSTRAITFADYSVEDVITKSFEIMNTGSGGILIDRIDYPTGFSGNWDGVIHSSESKTIQFTFVPSDLEEFNNEMVIRYNGNQSARLTLTNTEILLSANESLEFQVYPNPAINGKINIKGASTTSAEVLNLNGQVLLINTGNETIDVSNLPSGMYLLKITNGKTVKVEKVFVNN